MDTVRVECIDRNVALALTLQKFNISQASLCRLTQALENIGRGKAVQTDQLNRYLKGSKDIYGRGLATIEVALDPLARAYYRSLVEAAESEIAQHLTYA